MHIGEGAAEELWQQLNKPFIIADKALVAHCPSQLHSRTALLPAVMDAQSSKAIDRLVKCLADKGYSSGDLVALGGCNICELLSNVAVAYTGAKWHSIPNTLVSMLGSIDSANAKRKTQPNTVVIDPLLLKSTERDYRAGLAEIVALGLLDGDLLYDTLLRYPELIHEAEPGIMADVLAMCGGTKADFIAAAVSGRPTVLSIGHTAAAAIVQDLGGAVGLGEVLAAGIFMEAKAGERLGLTDKETVEEIANLLHTYGFNTSYSFQSEPDIAGDADTLIIPFVKEVGNTILEKVDKASFAAALA
jgi:3-dehydroquinate synthetase